MAITIPTICTGLRKRLGRGSRSGWSNRWSDPHDADQHYHKLLEKLVAHAAAFEHVSPAEFPANREINREFGRIYPLDAILNVNPRGESEACSEIPYAREQGIIPPEQGILLQEQRI